MLIQTRFNEGNNVRADSIFSKYSSRPVKFLTRVGRLLAGSMKLWKLFIFLGNPIDFSSFILEKSKVFLKYALAERSILCTYFLDCDLTW